MRSRILRMAVAVGLTLGVALAVNPPLSAFQIEEQEVSSQEADETLDDLWGFEDDDDGVAIPTWTEDLRDQAFDLAMLTGFATLTLVGFFRKSELLKWITMGASVVYLGFAKSQLISIVNIFALTEWNLPVFRYNLTWYLFAIFTVVTTILWGRLYCGRVCAFGALTQLMDKAVPARLRFELPKKLDQRAAYIKYGLLGATVLYFIVTKDISIYRYSPSGCSRCRRRR